jgi:tetratricopeptide (TPR) repeat protein
MTTNVDMDRQSLHRKIRELAAVQKGEAHVLVLLEQYVRRHPDDIVAVLAYGDALRVVGRTSEAIALFKAAYESFKGPKGRAELAMSLAMATRALAPAEAEQWFSRYLELKTDPPGWAWILRGANLATLERFDEAIECYKTALKQSEVDLDEALKNIALAYRAKGNYSEAMAFLRRSSMVTQSDSEIAQLKAGLEGLEQTELLAKSLS